MIDRNYSPKNKINKKMAGRDGPMGLMKGKVWLRVVWWAGTGPGWEKCLLDVMEFRYS
jgi:hypothetical protein